MMDEQTLRRSNRGFVKRPNTIESTLHPAWRSFIEYCAELNHGEIETLKIQDGVPVLAEVVTKKIKFAS